ncbi:MAG: MFS transporter [Christensenellaceae bacterium]|nr:MFS transporter [Christensenellaceae bacterium]
MKKIKTSPVMLKMTSFSLGLTFVRNHVTNVFVLDIAKSFDLNKVELGAMLSSRFIAQIFISLIMGRVADVIGKKKVLILAFLLEILGTFVMSVSPVIGLYVAGVIIQGCGNACVSVSLTPALADAYPDKATRLLSLQQAFGSTIGIISPLIISAVTRATGGTWRQALWFVDCLILIPLIFTFFAEFKDVRVKREGTEEKRSTVRDVIKVLGNGALIFAAISITFYCAMDNTYVSYATMFFKNVFGAENFGAMALSIHSACYAVSRFLTGFVKPEQEKKVSVTCLVVNFIAFVTITLIGSAPAALVLCAVISLSAGPVYTLLLGYAAKSDPENSATATSIMIVGNGLGGAGGAFLAGVVADVFDIKWTFIMLGICSVISVTTYIISKRIDKKRKEAAAMAAQI